MRLTELASISPERGSGTRLGVRTRKKHKKLDSISEDVFNRNRNGEMGSGGGDCVENDDSELRRRSSRVRKVPEVLDSSPPPKRKRREIEGFGRGGGRGGLRRGKGKGKVEEDEVGDSGGGSSEEELGAWKSRLRVKGTGKGKGKKSRGKRKLFEEDEEDVRSMKDDLEEDSGGEKSGDEEDVKVGSVGGSRDGGNEIEDDQVVGEMLANGASVEVGDCTVSISGRVEVNEEILDGGSVSLVEKENDVPADIMPEEKVVLNENMGQSSENDKPVISSEPVQDAEIQSMTMEDDTLPTDLAVNNKTIIKDADAAVEVRQEELENCPTVKNCSVAANGVARPRVKEGRRCGLCGGGTDGKPPKRLVTDSAGSDNEAYSGSSASEEFSYDEWDGFGDESGWLGKLLGPVNDRHGIAGIWVHQHCAVWSPEVYFAGLGCLKNIRAALCRGRALKCSRCGRPGATLGCRVDRCPRTYHLPCARATGCIFDHRKFMIACADHRYLFEPQGIQYSQRIKKLKAKKMKMEIRKISNDASRKDLEAEERWLEKCGEDEEFLRRETKRLQRDVLRIAPVYIGGPHSEGGQHFDGWDSVAGLQDVVQCMKEVVILPLLYPEFYQNMGITPPRGVLLHGYPGTGKTLVVRALIGSCARGDRRIAYFARKGADCLGKYVGDAERQLRLLFQVAEKSQPSVIFFDEIDGLAPVRTRQQDQTHSSVVSTLLALMDGLKSRGSVIVIGATNRPDSVDPALRRPGRFDREIYFPLPSVKDRAAILALHTRKWPKPVAGPLLEWVATKTLGFAGADLQALCSQVAVIALKRNCPWHQILSCAEENSDQRRRPKLPSFAVEERDWLEALSLAPPPCSRREAGMAANEVLGIPLDIHLIPCLLQPLLSLIISLYLDDRLWLPHCLATAASAIKKVVLSEMEKKNLQDDKWWRCAQSMAKDPNTAREIVRDLCLVGIVYGDSSLPECATSKDVSCDDGGFRQCNFGDNPFGIQRNVCYAPLKKTGYRIMISGVPRAGQKHLASCLLHCFLGNIEMQKIDLATISQEGHGNMEQGISRILMKCASLKMCAIFMPRIDLWAIESSVEQDVMVSPILELSNESSLTSRQAGTKECSSGTSELVREPESENEICHVSKRWKSFREQLECLCASSSLIILATSEVPCAALPSEVRQFFESESLAPEGSFISGYETSRFSVEVNGEFDRDKLINLSAIDLSRNLIQQFVHVAYLGSHHNSDSSITHKEQFEDKRDVVTPKIILTSAEEPEARKEPSEDLLAKLQVPSAYKNVKEKSTLVLGVTSFGYQILRYPHFAELCWVTSKLSEGPSADIRGPWKGWPFNSCIVRPGQLMQNDVAACNSNNLKKRDKFTLVRGLIAVGLSAYRGVYKSSREVSMEVRKVLELLVGQIAARIQAGKDRYQYIRLLSQVAYLEDMVANWSHSLRSLEPEDHTQVMICKLGGAQSQENYEVPTVEPIGVEEKPNAEGTRFQEMQRPAGCRQGSSAEGSGAADLNVPADCLQNPELVEGGLQGSLAGSLQVGVLITSAVEVDFNNQTSFEPELVEGAFQGSLTESCRPTVLTTEAGDVGPDNQTNLEPELVEGGLRGSLMEISQLGNLTTVPVDVGADKQPDFVNLDDEMSPEKAVIQDSLNKVALASIPATGTDTVDTAIIGQACDVTYNDCRESKMSASVNVEDPAVSQVASTEILAQEKDATCKYIAVEPCGSTETCSQSSPEQVTKNEISAKAETHGNDAGLNLSNCEMSTESKVVCCYSCCTGCISNLQRLVKKVVIRDWELSGSCSTVEDIHDIVSSLSTSLYSAVRNLYVTGQCRCPIDGDLNSDVSTNFNSQEPNACQCCISESGSTKLMNCVCHSGKDELKSSLSSHDQPSFNSRYMFRDGVLMSAETNDEQSSVHCKYETLCLGSLIELIGKHQAATRLI